MQFSLFLPAEKATKKRNLCDVYLRVTQDGKRTLIKTDVKILSTQWDASKQKVTNNHHDSFILNKMLQDILAFASETFKKIQQKEKTVSLSRFKKILLEKEVVDVDFVSFAKELLKRYLVGKQGGTYNKNASILKKIISYAKSETIPFQKIDIAFCSGYEKFCKDKYKNKNSTIANSIKFIRKVINAAIAEGHTEKDRTKGYKISIAKSERIFLTEQEILAFEKVEVNTKQDQQIKDMFLLAAKYTGLRVSDLLFLKVKNFKNGQITFRIVKTKKPHQIPLHLEAEKIIQKYCQGKQQEDHLFPFKYSKFLCCDTIEPLEQQRLYKTTLSYYNKVLKKLALRAGLEKKVTSHVARHSLACYWIFKGKSIYFLRDLLSHSSVRETEIYAKMDISRMKDEISDLYA